jgi:cephalosporin-C deacetylase-like acetyl esterase
MQRLDFSACHTTFAVATKRRVVWQAPYIPFGQGQQEGCESMIDHPQSSSRIRTVCARLFKASGLPFAAGALALAAPLKADVPELLELVPDAKGYELIYKFNPLEYAAKGYQVDNGESYSGTLKKLGYLLKTTDQQGKMTWVFAAMEAFSQDLNQVGVPNAGSGVVQTYVTALEVSGNSPHVKTGTFEKGNIEFWPNNYAGGNAKKIPGATDQYDFGDSVGQPVVGHGSMQVHNYLEKQTVFAFNSIRSNRNCELGIGSNTTKTGHPDWTFSKSGKTYKTAEMLVVGQFDNLVIKKVIKLDPQKVSFRGDLEKPFVAPGEPMNFTFSVDFGDQPVPEKPYTLKWTRSGDDGQKASGSEPVVSGEPIVVTTSLDKPGFVRLQAMLVDHKGRAVRKKDQRGRMGNISFDGGAGVEIAKLQPAADEPADFDAFWAKQKAKLDAVPVKYNMEKLSKPGAEVEVYAVSVDCAGPRPVTGYLTIPAGAKEKSLPASASYHGYGTRTQHAPGSGSNGRIHFNMNAHGYDLGKDAEYYKEFVASIKSNGQIYAFDPKQNSDPETAYFNGMALRVMRSLQFLKSLPQWNGKDLSVSGGSQGGLQTVWAAALDPDVTHANSSITWCCDFAGPTQGRLGGWRPAYVPALNYYDSVFHAKRIKCPIVISRAGLGDYTCPPSGLAILYNNISSPKKIVWYQGSTHGFVPPKPHKITVEQP